MPPISTSSARAEFAKELGLKEAVSIAVGAMIGGGVYSVLGRLAGIAGPAAVVSYILGGIIVLLTANSYFRLVSKYPSAGGEFVILRRGFDNPLIGNSIGMMLWLGYSVTIALYGFTFGLYVSEFLYDITDLSFFDTQSGEILTGRKTLAFLAIFLFMIINLKGVKETGTIQTIIVILSVSVLLIFGLLGIIYFKGERYRPFTVKEDPYQLMSTDVLGGFSGIIIGSAVIFVTYEGFQVIANIVEEMKNPAKNVKFGMYFAVIIVTITYCTVTIATFSLVSDSTKISDAALMQAVKDSNFGIWAVLLITIGAAACTTSAINATLLGSSRLAYVMSDWGAFPKRLAVISKNSKVPYLAIITTSAISWFFTLFGSAKEIAEVASIIFLGIFLSINLSIPKIFPNERNVIAKFASILITIYMLLVFGYFLTHLDESMLALVVLFLFTGITFIWMFINQRSDSVGEVDVTKYALEPLGMELIQEFIPPRVRTDEFFIDLESMLVPVSGNKFETQNWLISAIIARKYNAEITLLYVGKEDSKLDKPREVFDRYGVKYHVLIRPRNRKSVPQIIIDVYNEGTYQLINLASRRKKGLYDRLFDTSVSKTVVDNVDAAILQVHPPKYGQSREDIAIMFLLLDGSERDTYLNRWANIISSVGTMSKVFAYHIVQIPQTISLEDAADFREVKQSARDFEVYARELCERSGVEAEPILLYGHNFVKSLVQATQNREPDAVLIGHTKDTGLWDRIRTRLAYRILNKVDSAVIVYHMPKNSENQSN
ncbi:MAG: amino acid permease [Candidatus Kariarchaeaceae archaeon]